MQSLLNKQKGVVYTQVGYIGDDKINPTYESICSGNTAFVEAVRVIFDPSVTSITDIIKLFFEIHDFSQIDGQGPDIGTQYLSKIFYYNNEQKAAAYEIIKLLESKHFKVATTLQTASAFWPAEEYHQDYYDKNGKQPYCHSRKMIFG